MKVEPKFNDAVQTAMVCCTMLLIEEEAILPPDYKARIRKALAIITAQSTKSQISPEEILDAIFEQYGV